MTEIRGIMKGLQVKADFGSQSLNTSSEQTRKARRSFFSA